jgi:hypothetical protein
MTFADPAKAPATGPPANRPFAFALPAGLAKCTRARAGGDAMKRIAARPGAAGDNPIAGAGKGGKRRRERAVAGPRPRLRLIDCRPDLYESLSAAWRRRELRLIAIALTLTIASVAALWLFG